MSKTATVIRALLNFARAAVPSFVGAGAFVATAFVIVVLSPHNFDLKINAKGLEDGKRQVTVRAVDPDDTTKNLAIDTTTARIENGVLKAKWTPPNKLKGKLFIINKKNPRFKQRQG